MYLGKRLIDEYLTFTVNTHLASTGAATDASSVTYRIYEDETGTPLLTGSMSLFDVSNTVGYYSEQVQLTAANGFEIGKSYSIYVEATVTIIGTNGYSFQIEVSLATAAALQTVNDLITALKDFDPANDDVALVTGISNPVEIDSASRIASRADVSNLDVAVSSRSSHSAANVWAVGTRSLTTFGTLVADVASAVWATATKVVTSVANAVTTDSASRTASQANVSALALEATVDALAIVVAALNNFDPSTDSVDVDKFLGTTITETNAGDIAESLSFFFDVDPVTTKTVNDVGVAGAGLTAQNVWEYATRILTAAVETDSASRTASKADVSNLDVAVSSRSSHSAADIWSVTTRALTTFGTLVANMAAAVWDRVLTGATHNIATSAGRRLRGIQDFQGYENGSIWVDTINGSAGTTEYENGTVENPVDTWADALTLSASLGIKRFTIAGASTITLSANSDTYVLMGSNWTLNLNGQSIVGAHFHGAEVSGVASGIGIMQVFNNCVMNVTSHIKNTHITNSGFAATQTVIEAGDFFIDNCHSEIAGTATWIWDFGDAIGDTNFNVRHYSGGIQLESMGNTGIDTASIEGYGHIIEGTCTGGVVAIRGNFTVSGITNLTLSDGARIDIDNIWDEILTAAIHNVPGSAGRRLRDIASDIILTGTSPNTGGIANTAIRIELDEDASTMDGAYDPGTVIISEGKGAGQTRSIWEYDGTNKYVYINRSWKDIPDNTSKYTVRGDSGNTHVNEGLVTGGGNSMIQLNALASSVDNTYVGQTVFLAAGTGEDQQRRIISYNGTNKQAIVDRPWETNPVNGETIYAILPVADVSALALETTVNAVGVLVGALQDLSADQVNAQIVDVLRTDVVGEPGQGTPPEYASMQLKVDHIYKFLINVNNATDSLLQILNYAGDTVDHKATLSDDNTTSEQGKIVTGP